MVGTACLFKGCICSNYFFFLQEKKKLIISKIKKLINFCQTWKQLVKMPNLCSGRRAQRVWWLGCWEALADSGAVLAPSERQRSRQVRAGSAKPLPVELWQGAGPAELKKASLPSSEVLTVSLFFLSQGLRTAGTTLLPWTELPRRRRYSRKSYLGTIECWPLEKQ